MSTRGQIMIEGDSIKLYKHSDSYPEETLPTLFTFVQDFMERRGFDQAYMMARLAFAFMRDHSYDPYLGFGLDNDFHGDIEYVYIVRKTTIDVYTTHGRTSGHILDCTGQEINESRMDPCCIRVSKLGSYPHNAKVPDVLKDLAT